ncbi:MAG: hypothetical protein WDN76_10700 [Alphaproteobacteria bacterium]
MAASTSMALRLGANAYALSVIVLPSASGFVGYFILAATGLFVRSLTVASSSSTPASDMLLQLLIAFTIDKFSDQPTILRPHNHCTFS